MKLIYLNIFILCTSISFGQTGLVGQINNFNEEKAKVYLLKVKTADDFYNGSSALVIDSATINEKGKFHFSNFNALSKEWVYRINFTQEGQMPGLIVRDYVNNNYLFVVNDGKPIEITCSLPALSRDYSIKSQSPINHYFQKVLTSEDSIYIRIQDYIKQQMEQQPTAEQAAESKLQLFESLKLYVANELHQPIKNNLAEGEITDPRLLAFIVKHFEFDYNLKEDAAQIHDIIKATKHIHPYIKDIEKKLEHSVFADTPFPHFSMQSIEGKTINLNEIEAKIALVDFWASWCSPCRSENRNVVKPLYEQYKSMGFEVVGINLDDDYEKWQNAAKQDGIEWIQVGDTLGKQSPLHETYQIESLPTTYLLDHNKKVIHKNLRGEALTLFVENYFKTKTAE